MCPGWESCSDPDTMCTTSKCCNDDGFTCYQVHEHYSHCMRTGTCEQQVATRLKTSGSPLIEWDKVSAVTCFVAEHDEDLDVHFERAGGGRPVEPREKTDTPIARDDPQRSLIFTAAADTTAAVARLSTMQQRLQEDMKALEALEARLQMDLVSNVQERQRISMAEALIGIFLGVMLITGIAAFALLWSRLRQNELRYQQFDRQRGDPNPNQQHHVANIEVPTLGFSTLNEGGGPSESERQSGVASEGNTPGSTKALINGIRAGHAL